MNAEEEKQIKILLGKDATFAHQKAALTWLGNYLEEGDILNLPASKRTLDSLDRFSRSATADRVLKSKAKKLTNQFRRY